MHAARYRCGSQDAQRFVEKGMHHVDSNPLESQFAEPSPPLPALVVCIMDKEVKVLRESLSE